ncbi:MAG: DUF2779 domain-containing protein [Desulfobacteraceae bacterium]|nr:MAG: DUF2779 domain-containing protein [Desulfobacteraceae bacterium]
MAGLSKSRIIQHLQCPKRLWFAVNRPELAKEVASVHTRLQVSTEVGEVARSLFPDGILIDTQDSSQALADTRQALAGKRRPLFEAAFAAESILIRVDLLFPSRAGYRLVEVKSSTSVKEHQLADAAIQSWVAKMAGLTLKRIEIAHIDNSFIYPGNGNYKGLFALKDVTREAGRLEREVPHWVKMAQRTLAGLEPNIATGDQCSNPFPCPFEAHCTPYPGDDVFLPEILPYKNGKALAAELRAAGFNDIRNIPADRFVAARHQRIWEVTRSGEPILDPAAGKELQALPFPRYYLDFETIQFAVPIWAGTRPYQQLPFQWSCHIESKNGTIQHKDFLAEDSSDPRQAFVESLIETLGTRGPVFAYNASFEAGRLREAAQYFPALSQALGAICDRLIDLLPLARNHYYHRDMRGSWSLKAVLPTIAPELAYNDLEVGDGGMAQEAFGEILHPETRPARVQELRKALRAYCERDTRALVAIAHFFQGR